MKLVFYSGPEYETIEIRQQQHSNSPSFFPGEHAPFSGSGEYAMKSRAVKNFTGKNIRSTYMVIYQRKAL
jgi:hypothetical protein